MFTLKDYDEGKCTRREFIGQFVTPRIKRQVINMFGIERLVNAPDQKNFNSIPLKEWDRLTGYGNPNFRASAYTHDKIREAGESPTYSLYTCIYKEAARQIVAEAKSSIQTT